MPSLAVALGAVILLTLGVECALWVAFRRKVVGLTFPREADESFFRFFTVTRMRIAAASHAVALIAIDTILLLWLW